MSDWKESKAIVGEEEGSERQVSAYAAKDDRVGLHVHDLKGGKEYEFHLWVTAEYKDKLIVALMEHLYGERQSCASGFEELMKENGIVCERRREWKESKTIVARGILLTDGCWPLWERMTGWAFRCMRWEGREGARIINFTWKCPGKKRTS